MRPTSPTQQHRTATRHLARALKPVDIYRWLIKHGFYPEAYVLPPCYRVVRGPHRPKAYFTHTQTKYKVPTTDYIRVHYPKTELTDRTFGVINPLIYNDIAYNIYRNWKAVVRAMIPRDSVVSSYTFPIPIDTRSPGRMGTLRSGRMIYEFISMTDDDLATVAYKYTHILKTDIKNFYPSIYTHSIAWALHGKSTIQRGTNRWNFKLLGNRLDKLFQNANGGCTNGLPIGPVVSDIAAEIVASAVDRLFSKELKHQNIQCEAVRFKDDYRILVLSAEHAKKIINILQASLKEYNLELSDDKTVIHTLPDGLFRPWVSRYHLAHPRKKKYFTWKQFRELYLAVIDIDRTYLGTGVIDRFLADITTQEGQLKIAIGHFNLEKVVSMLLMIGSLRIKAFPKVIAILERLTRSTENGAITEQVVNHLESYLKTLADDEARNKYLISWICYFLASNGLLEKLKTKPVLKDAIARSSMSGRGKLFKGAPDFKLLEDVKHAGRRITLFKHLSVFDPPTN